MQKNRFVFIIVLAVISITLIFYALIYRQVLDYFSNYYPNEINDMNIGNSIELITILDKYPISEKDINSAKIFETSFYISKFREYEIYKGSNYSFVSLVSGENEKNCVNEYKYSSREYIEKFFNDYIPNSYNSFLSVYTDNSKYFCDNYLKFNGKLYMLDAKLIGQIVKPDDDISLVDYVKLNYIFRIENSFPLFFHSDYIIKNNKSNLSANLTINEICIQGSSLNLKTQVYSFLNLKKIIFYTVYKSESDLALLVDGIYRYTLTNYAGNIELKSERIGWLNCDNQQH